ncbi:MAG TPA: hypothetical protein VF535_01090 [Allosphingosinicella sp.]|jgi:hypothetical protein
MADVAIIHAADKATAAGRLSESIIAAGYDVSAVEIEDPGQLADAVDGCAADARILIWSRPLVSHLLHSGELPRLRQLANLIEVSADGITPPSRGDDARVVLISGWRGQPFHPGWQRIQLDLKRLCGSRKNIAEVPRAAAKPVGSGPPPAAASTPGRDSLKTPSRLVLAGTIAVLLVGGAIGAASWLGGRAPDNGTGPQVSKAGPAKASVGPPLPSLPTPKTAAAAETEPTGTDVAPALRPESAVPANGRAERPKAVRPARSTRPEAAGRVPDRAPPAAGPPKKYSRKYSKVMRQFCERSGRATPQCRTFLRSTQSD